MPELSDDLFLCILVVLGIAAAWAASCTVGGRVGRWFDGVQDDTEWPK